MAYSARIDELEKKFTENARRYFAPLANEYRKAGDLERAIEICRAHLPQQPGHMSGHIVYGQALYESRQLDEAKTVFEAALALDPENLIALRHLGDIARDSSDSATARTWYLRVLDADPRNEDVAAMLAELDTAAAEAPSAPVAEGSSGWGDINPERSGEGAEAASSGEGAADAASQTEQDTPAAASEEEPVVVAEPDQSAEIGLEPMPGDGAVEGVTGEAATSRGQVPAEAAPRAPRAEPSVDRVLSEAFAPGADAPEADAPEADALEAAAGVEPLSSAAFARPDAQKEVLAPRGAAADGGTENKSGSPEDGEFAEVDALFDEIAPSSAAPSPSGGAKAVQDSAARPAADASAPSRAPAPERPADATADAWFGDGDSGREDVQQTGDTGRLAGLETSEFVAPARPEPAPTARRTTGSMAVSGLTSFEQPRDEDSSTRAAFVTETMAELYLQQGFTAEALDIYRQLLEQNPGDSNLRDRIAQLESGEGSSLSVAAVSSEVIQAARQRHAARPVRTARSFFGRLAGHHIGQGAGSSEAPADDRQVEEGEPVAATASTAPPEAARDIREARITASSITVVSDLFGESRVSDADEAAASMLASAFSPGFGDSTARTSAPVSQPSSGNATASTTGRAAHTAGRELSLDQVFRDSSSRTPRKSGPVSFDQFFSESTPAGGTHRPTPTPAQAPDDAQDPEGDLEQFTAWLEGLKRK